MNANDVPIRNQEEIDKEKTDEKEEENGGLDHEVVVFVERPLTATATATPTPAPDTAGAGDKNQNQDSPTQAIASIEPSTELPPTLHERFLRIRQLVKDTISNRRTFMVYGRARVIRECMLKRGWCEKYFRKTTGDQFLSPDSNPITLLAGIGDLKDLQSERLLISKMLSNHPVDFLWNTGSEWPGWPSQDNKTTIFNRYSRAGFTSKVGLCSNVRQMHWHYEAGVANTLFPRCYNICQGDQMHAFMEDFRFTACLGLLKWLVDKIGGEGENAVRSPTGSIPIKALDFAIKRCSDYISAQAHEDIDQEVEKVWSHQWDQFISWYYKIVQGQALFVRNSVSFHKYYLAARHILKKMRKYWPQIDMDGIMNVWILKPGNKSRGRGIVLMSRLEEVVAKVNPSTKCDTRFVVQKYIERPLLIYSTKFDIRQWFVVTCAQPLTFWMYKESYLRFCSQKFSLSDLHESIHLCNHAIQCKYTNSEERDPALPADNMWDAVTFKEFLKEQGHGEAWDQLIYPGMRQGLVGSLLASQEAMDRRRNSFELYGADFMVMEDFSVWLIEINSHPDMSYSTSVTTRLCRQVMEDTVKVVIDFREDKTADTGSFELAYRQRMPSCQPYLGAALSLQGTRINTSDKKSTTSVQESKVSLVSKSPVTCIATKKSTVHSHVGPVIVDLIEELELQLDHEFYEYYKLESSNIRQPLPLTAPTKFTGAMNSNGALLSTGKKSTSAGTMTVSVRTKTQSTSQDQQQLGASKVSNTVSKPKSKGKGKLSSGATSSKKEPVSSNKPHVISKIMSFQRQSNNMATKSKQSEHKVINAAMREAVTKYKRTGTVSTELSLLPTLLGPSAKSGHSSSNKSKISQKKYVRRKKDKVLRDITDIYAVGQRLSK